MLVEYQGKWIMFDVKYTQKVGESKHGWIKIS